MIQVDEISQYTSEKILSFEQTIRKITELKKSGQIVGLCHGGFDLTHPGHVKHFESAKKLCDVLIVSITSDRFVASRKGSGRPIYSDFLRAYMISSIIFVDYVVITDFAKGTEIINNLQPSFYIKGPDFINKITPGITAEREAIKAVGGEMKYTTEPPMSTTKIIDYVKNEVIDKELLLIIDRDGTLIENDDFFGRNDNWQDELKYKKNVIDFISYLQTKYKTTGIVVSNQTGVARMFFDCERVEKINNLVHQHLNTQKVKISSWQYCPDADAAYTETKKSQLGYSFDNNFVKEVTRRKPHLTMVDDALKELNRDFSEFSEIVVIGNAEDDKLLADNIKGKDIKTIFVNVTDKNYEDLIKVYN